MATDSFPWWRTALSGFLAWPFDNLWWGSAAKPESTEGRPLGQPRFLTIDILAVVQGGSEVTKGFLVFPALGLAAAGIAWRLDKWALVVAAAFGLLNLLLHGFFLIGPLTRPSSFLDFFLALLVTVGLVLAMTGALASYFQHSRGRLRTSSTVMERRALAVLGAAVLLLGLVSAAMDFSGRAVVTAEARSGATLLRMKAVKFEPDLMEVRAGEAVPVTVTKHGSPPLAPRRARTVAWA